MSIGRAAHGRLTVAAAKADDYDQGVSVDRSSTHAPAGDPRRATPRRGDGSSSCIPTIRVDEHAAAKLHDVLQRAALHELHRRRGQLQALSGPELDDVAQQCANDAMMKILARIDDFEGLSRFTTWAYKFVIFEVSNKVARHAWQHHPPSAEELTWERLPDTLDAQARRSGRAPRAARGADEGRSRRT